jgi:general secretion pathway protein G
MSPRRWFHGGSAGYTFIELVVATAVLMILASAALPIARVSMRRQNEADLRRILREMRTAIDQYKDYADRNMLAMTETRPGMENYPPNLEVLVEGVPLAGDATNRRKKFLRRIPVDPITGRAEWGLRSYTDLPDSKTWGGLNVFDVYSTAEGRGLDGSLYRDW